MFDKLSCSSSSSSSSSTKKSKTPFNAVKEAASIISRRRKLPTNPDLQQQIEHIFSQPVQRNEARNEPRKSRYVAKLVQNAKRRKEEAQLVLERRMIREREKEQHLFGHTERFVTPAYKKRLEDNERLASVESHEQSEQPSAHNVSQFYTALLHNKTINANETDSERSQPTAHIEPATNKAAQEKLASRTTSQHSHSPSTAIKQPAGDDRRATTKDSKSVIPGAIATHQTPSPQPRTQQKPSQKRLPNKKRGVRRNTPQSIEAYRQRYFARRAKRLAEKKS
ncbi:unnamed protein product [Agarophyton chilense]